MTGVSLTLFGYPAVYLDGLPLARSLAAKELALLAYLAMNAARPQQRDVLATLFWPERPSRAAHANLRTVLARLQRGLRRAEVAGGVAAAGPPEHPPCLVIAQDTIEFTPSIRDKLDVREFRARLSNLGPVVDGSSAPSTTEAAIRNLQAAIALYRGPLLDGLFLDGCAEFENWLLYERERHRLQAQAALHLLARTHMQLEEYGEVQEDARRLLELDPLDEEASRLLMRALAHSGQRNAGLTEYKTRRRVLGEELGVEPSAETTAVYQDVRDEGALRPPAQPAGKGAVSNSKPGAPASGNGRESELEDQEPAGRAEVAAIAARIMLLDANQRERVCTVVKEVLNALGVPR